MILPARFRFHKTAALLKAHRESKLEPPKRKKLKFCHPSLYRSLACPHCAEVLDVYQRPMGDEWACCPGCGYADDVPGTVSVALGCTLEEAVEFLVFQHNLHHVPNSDIEHYLEVKARYDLFAELLKERIYRDYKLNNHDSEHGLPEMALNRLLDKLDLRSYIGGEPELMISLSKKDRIRLPKQRQFFQDSDPRLPGHVPTRRLPCQYETDFFGFAYKGVIESWFFPHLYNPVKRKVRANSSPNRLFPGQGWELVLVIPLQDVPGHFCGILCIGREGVYPTDYVIRLFPDYDVRSTNTGFIIPFKAYQTLRKLKNAEDRQEDVEPEKRQEAFMIAYNNPLHLIRTIIQCKRGFGTPPLFGWVDFFEKASSLKTSDWSPFEQIRKKIFWVQKHHNKTMRTIVEQEGRVLPYNMKLPYPGVEEFKVLGNPLFRPNPLVIAQMEADAVPWPDYFAERFQYLAPQEAVEELRQITLNPKRFEDCLARLPSTPRIETVRRFASTSTDIKQIRVGQYEIHEEPAGWTRKTDRQTSLSLASNVRCYIDQLQLGREGEKKYYRGRIIYGDQTIPFRVSVCRFEKDAIGFVRNILHRINLPEPVINCKNRFYKALVKAVSNTKTVEVAG